MVNKAWLEQDMRGMTEFLTPGHTSDYTPCLVTIMGEGEQVNKPFKFYNMWTTHEDYNIVVANKWILTSSLIEGTPEDEIRHALFNIGDQKASGSDNYGANFFKHSWDIIKRDLEATVMEFFSHGKLLK
ncbi:hypothetical protein ZIOFF_002060 [Zingiber officinale]|uniref:Uncharacterized protein n=1 Tax=Zingiber officinale TaxID=94328 RepID=A0A8J5HZE4_ZINOF|nr:hypothetical protein ZIOFF_002060 [Zingiber officinale]